MSYKNQLIHWFCRSIDRFLFDSNFGSFSLAFQQIITKKNLMKFN